MNKSEQLFQRACARIPGGVNSPVRAFRRLDRAPFFVESAKGCHLKDVDGKQYIDYVGTWGPAILGHGAPCVIDAVQQAITAGLGYGTPTPIEVEMAEHICKLYPAIEKVRMTNSGTEASMSAIRLARGFTGRKYIIKFEGCYHGHVDSLLVAAGSGALTHGQPDSLGVPEEFTSLTLLAPYNDKAAVKALFERYGKDIAAIIVEPYPGNAGFYLPIDGFLDYLREVSTQHGALLIFDEVMTGFRISASGVQGKLGMQPDLTCLGKIIGGGLPVGAFGGRADIMDCLSPLGGVYQAGTLSGNPIALAAGMAQLKELQRSNAYDQLEQRGMQLEEGVKRILAEQGLHLCFKRSGSMFSLFFTETDVVNLSTAMQSDFERFKIYFNSMIEQGVFVAPSPYEAGFLSTAHTEADIAHTLTAMEIALKKSYA